MARIHESKKSYINSIVNYIKTNYPTRISKIVVFGDSVDETNDQPNSLDIAVKLTNIEDETDFSMLGDILAYMGELVTKGDCNLIPISENLIKKSCLNEIYKGVTVYET